MSILIVYAKVAFIFYVVLLFGKLNNDILEKRSLKIGQCLVYALIWPRTLYLVIRLSRRN
jgi:hypothetical protein